MSFKKIKKLVNQYGFTLYQADYYIILMNRKTGYSRHYNELKDAEPDIEEILEGYAPF